MNNQTKLLKLNNWYKCVCGLSKHKTHKNTKSAQIMEKVQVESKEQQKRIEDLTQQLTEVRLENGKMQEAMLELETRSMRDNLISYGRSETNGENCEDKAG